MYFAVEHASVVLVADFQAEVHGTLCDGSAVGIKQATADVEL